jgi:DNA (cytosine-5)-methyltransferase 1
MGLHRAGFDVTGVDIRPQKRYPFAFQQGDALEADLDGFDVAWASPPCQRYSLASVRHRNEGKVYPDLVALIREKLKRWGGPWIMENVVNAPLSGNVVMLCGTMFGLGVFRHRLFESNFLLLVPAHSGHSGTIGDGKYFSVAGGSGRWKSWGTVHRNVSKGTATEWRQAMGIDWMTRDEIKEAIPPAYSEFLGAQILAALKAGNAEMRHGEQIP